MFGRTDNRVDERRDEETINMKGVEEYYGI
jgi:hypothetical protein